MASLSKKKSRNAVQTDYDGEVSNFAKIIAQNHGSGPVKHYRPGDPGFEELARQYKHPSQNKKSNKASYQGDFKVRKAA